MDPIYVTGHRNPDTDSIVAAMAYAALRNALGDREYEAACLGRVSDETQLVLDRTDDWDAATVVCIVDSAFRPMFENETDYTVSVYILNEEAFAAGQAAEAAKGKTYNMDTLWAYSKSGPKKDAYGSLVKVATATVHLDENTGEVLSFEITPVK